MPYDSILKPRTMFVQSLKKKFFRLANISRIWNYSLNDAIRRNGWALVFWRDAAKNWWHFFLVWVRQQATILTKKRVSFYNMFPIALNSLFFFLFSRKRWKWKDSEEKKKKNTPAALLYSNDKTIIIEWASMTCKCQLYTFVILYISCKLTR